MGLDQLEDYTDREGIFNITFITPKSLRGLVLLSSPSPKPNPNPKPKEIKNPKSYVTGVDTMITWATTPPHPTYNF